VVEDVLESVGVRMYCSGVVPDGCVVVSGVVSFLGANKGRVAHLARWSWKAGEGTASPEP
jgi:hypothetical protein